MVTPNIIRLLEENGKYEKVRTVEGEHDAELYGSSQRIKADGHQIINLK